MVKFQNILVIFAVFELTVASSGYPSCHESNLQWFPHQTECNSYFLCHHANAVHRYCAPELHFNDETGQCMIPSEAKCTLKCPAVDDPANPIFLPDFNDCSKFFICYNGIAIHRSCASGLRFDTENNWCNFEEQVCCGYRGENNSTIPPPPPEAEPPQPPIDPPSMNCPLERGPLYFPHPTRCAKYFKCYMGISYLVDCPNGLEYDQNEERCRANADCYARNPTTASP